MPKAKNSADTAKKATRSKKPVAVASDATTAAAAPARERSTEYGTIEERIRARAYELFLSRNGQGGSPETDWTQAETEILSSLERTA